MYSHTFYRKHPSIRRVTRVSRGLEHRLVSWPFLFDLCSCIPKLKENLFYMTGIGRHEMVALALLFGCDYCSGVPGVGIKTALKLLEELRGINILDR